MGRTVTVHDLPAELLQRIFAMLPHHEHIVHALMTCKAWWAPTVPWHICGVPCIQVDCVHSVCHVKHNASGPPAGSNLLALYTFACQATAGAAADKSRHGWRRHQMGLDPRLWATYAVRTGLPEALDCWRDGSIMGVTASGWQFLCDLSQLCCAVQSSLMHGRALQSDMLQVADRSQVLSHTAQGAI